MSAAAARGLFKNIRFHVGPRSLRSQGVSIENAQPVYDCGKLAWWARWTYFLVAADLVVTASACELTWNYWTMWEELPKDTTSPVPVESSKDDSQVVGHYVRRPLWQRSLFTATNLLAGIGLAAVLLGGRSRIVRRMFILPNPSSAGTSVGPGVADRLLVIQSPLHPRTHGAVYPLQRTKLVASPDPREMMVGMDDARGHYSIGLEGVQVGGQKLSAWDARKALFTTWYGEKKGAQMMLDSLKVKEAA